MPPDPVHQPNDKLLKATFSDPINASAFFRAHLSADVAGAIDWNSLQPEASSFIDAELAGSECDLLFTAKLHGKETLLYILFEHQSRENPWMAFRLLKYMVRIWDERSKGQPAPLNSPAILPVVLAQDKTLWKTPPHFHALFDLPPEEWRLVAPYTPEFMFKLIQLAEMPFNALKGTASGIMTLRALKAAPLGELLGDAVWDEELLIALPEGYRKRLVRFILNADVDMTAFERRVSRVRNLGLSQTVMTLAEQFRQQGLKEGSLERARSWVLDALQVRFETVPEGVADAVNNITDSAKLTELHKLAIRCTSLEDFAAGL